MIHPDRDLHSWLISVLVFCGVSLFLGAIVVSQPEIAEMLPGENLHGVALVRDVPQWLFVIASAFIVAGAFMDVRKRLNA